MYQELENLIFAIDSCTVLRKSSVLNVGITTIGNTQSNLHRQVCFDSEWLMQVHAKSLLS